MSSEKYIQQRIDSLNQEITDEEFDYSAWFEAFNKRMDEVILELKRAKVSLQQLQDEQI